MEKKYTYLIVIFLIIASLAAFGRIAGNDFINFDDPGYITENKHIQSGINAQSVKWAFTATVMGNWHPLTLLSHMLDWRLFGANATGHHLVNLLLHIGAVIFLFLFLNKTTNNIWPSAFAAALFALHPLRVESVAWAAERKDVLSMFCGMAALYAYASWAEKSKITQYLLCLILFALSLTAKPMLVTLPCVLLLLDYWPLGRWQTALSLVKATQAAIEGPEKKKVKQRKIDSIKEKNISAPVKNPGQSCGRLLREKVPFVILTIASGIATLRAQNKSGTIASMEHISFPERVANAITSYVSYLGKTFWPADLAVFYPYEHSFSLLSVIVSFLILIVITVFVVYYIKKQKYLFVGWFWYLGTLIPVIGLVQAGSQGMADRYTYLPSIGIAVGLAWGIPLLFRREYTHRKILFPVAIAVLIIMTFLTWHQCGYWKNSIELFNHALQATKHNVWAHNNLGLALLNEGKIEEAINHYNKAVSMKNDDADIYYNRGLAYLKRHKYQPAIEDFNKAVELKPDYILAYNNRAAIYFNQGNNEPGCRDAQKACALGVCKALEWANGNGLCLRL
jgi:hypothetical protein